MWLRDFKKTVQDRKQTALSRVPCWGAGAGGQGASFWLRLGRGVWGDPGSDQL